MSTQVAGSLTDVVVDTQRRKHLAYLMADHGAIVNPEASRNLPKQVCYSLRARCMRLINQMVNPMVNHFSIARDAFKVNLTLTELLRLVNQMVTG